MMKQNSKASRKMGFWDSIEDLIEDASSSPSPRPSKSVSPSISSKPSKVPSLTPSFEPSVTPSLSPTSIPSTAPIFVPSSKPTGYPSFSPSSLPSLTPTTSPSLKHSNDPSGNPTPTPTTSPTFEPSNHPSIEPTSIPSRIPSRFPSVQPTFVPSSQPSTFHSEYPSPEPSLSSKPSSIDAFSVDLTLSVKNAVTNLVEEEDMEIFRNTTLDFCSGCMSNANLIVKDLEAKILKQQLVHSALNIDIVISGEAINRINTSTETRIIITKCFSGQSEAFQEKLQDSPFDSSIFNTGGNSSLIWICLIVLSGLLMTLLLGFFVRRQGEVKSKIGKTKGVTDKYILKRHARKRDDLAFMEDQSINGYIEATTSNPNLSILTDEDSWVPDGLESITEIRGNVSSSKK